jgi:hypothetical protein
MGMDKSLHFRHVKAHENKCEQCHHEYDDKSKTLFYAKGREGTCRYCHMEETQENRISMREASHISCVDCHLKTKAKDLASGPLIVKDVMISQPGIKSKLSRISPYGKRSA